MTNKEFDFISFLFNDGDIIPMFKNNTVTFIPDNDEDNSILVIEYPGNMKKFLTILAGLDIPDYTYLCNIPAAAKSALHFIK